MFDSETNEGLKIRKAIRGISVMSIMWKLGDVYTGVYHVVLYFFWRVEIFYNKINETKGSAHYSKSLW